MNFFANNSGRKFEENYKIKKVLGRGKKMEFLARVSYLTP